MNDDSKKEEANPPQSPQGDASAVTPAIVESLKVHSLAKYINEVKKLGEFGEILWFRGHADDRNWQLAPSIFRPDLISKRVMNQRVQKLRKIEATANLDFLHHAKAREEKFPHDDDDVGQLVLARHHGLLSRLLDWSESPLTALFFAVERDGNKDENPACVWILAPGVLNKKQWGGSGIYYSHASVPKAITRCAFSSDATLENALKVIERKRQKKTEKLGIVAAFKPQHTIMRHMVQKAQFTIHHTPDKLNELQDAPEFLGKIIIPFNKREDILDELRGAGVSRDLLFPDLDNLSDHLNAEMKRYMK